MRSFLSMPLIVDSHQDLAWNILSFGRDYSRSAHETRRLEKNGLTVEHNGDTLLGWPEYQQGEVAVIFATLFSTPARWAYDWETYFYKEPKEADRHYRQQMDLYHRLTDDHPDKFRFIRSASDLDEVLASQQKADPAGEGYPVGLLPLMEGADCITRFQPAGRMVGDGLALHRSRLGRDALLRRHKGTRSADSRWTKAAGCDGRS